VKKILPRIGRRCRVARLPDLAAALKEGPWDVVLTDYRLPDSTALDALELVHQISPRTPLVVVSGVMDEEEAIETIRRGAYDYVMKNGLARLAGIVRNAIIEADLRAREHRSIGEIERLNRELLRKVGALTRSNADLEQFARAASHDLKEPLRAITNFSQLLLRRFAPVDDPEAREFAGYIREAVERMRGLMDGLLAYSSAEACAEDGSADAAAIVADVARGFETTLRDMNGTITTDELPGVAVHPAMLAQVFTNLIGNALKYANPNVPPHVHVSVTQGEGRVLFAVQDNCVGIAPEQQHRIFELFRRLHGSDIPGLGVGLAICKRLVERSGGRIWVESTVGSGATFFVDLPSSKSEASAMTTVAG